MPLDTSPPKIAVVIPKYGIAGGAEQFAAILTEKLAENPAYEIHVLANRWCSSSTAIFFHHIPMVSFPRFLSTISFAWFANRKATQLSCDLIHTHERIFYAHLFTMHGVPHRFWVRKIRKKKMRLFDQVTAWIEWRLLRNTSCQWLLPVSTLAAEQFLRDFPEIENRLRVIPPGIDLKRFHPDHREATRRRTREQLGINPSDLVILFVGMNFELKGLKTLIIAIARAKTKANGRSIRLVVVGKGNQSRYKKLAATMGIDNDLIFTGVCNTAIENFYAAADFYALLSDFDTFGMTVLEAMASGLPVLVSTMVGAKDLVVDGIQGYIVDTNNITAVAARIVDLLAEEKRTAMGCAARQVAEEHGWDTVVGKIQCIYDELLTKQLPKAKNN